MKRNTDTLLFEICSVITPIKWSQAQNIESAIGGKSGIWYQAIINDLIGTVLSLPHDDLIMIAMCLYDCLDRRLKPDLPPIEKYDHCLAFIINYSHITSSL